MTVSLDTDSGTVVEVSTATLGDELAADHAAGVTVLTVKDAVDFAPDGGWLTIGAETVYYTAAEDDEDNDVGLITLDTPTTAAYSEGERVLLDPPSFEKFAQVMVGDFGESVQATVPHDLWDDQALADGIYADGRGAVVGLTLDGSEFVVSRVFGTAPSRDGAFIDPATLPPAEVTTDGLAPASSPEPTVTGGLGVLFVRHGGITNADPVTYDYHLSTTTGFTPDASTLVASSPSSLVAVRSLTDGTTLEYDTDYYVRIVASDADGDGPASVEASGRLDRAGVADLAAGSVTAEHLAAVIVLVSKIASAESGRRWEADAAGIRVYESDGSLLIDFPTDASKAATFSGEVIAKHLEVLLGFILKGTGNEVAAGGGLYLGAGVSTPLTPPTVDVSWDTVQHAGLASNLSNHGLTLGHDSRWYTALDDTAGQTTWVRSYNTNGTVAADTALNSAYVPDGGVVYAAHHTGRYYLLTRSRGGGSTKFIEAYDTSFTLLKRTNLGGWASNKPTLGWDFTNGQLLLGWTSASGATNVYHYTADAAGNLSLASAWQTGTFDYPHDLGFVTRGSFDYGADRYVFRRSAGANQDDFRVYTTTASPTRQTNDEWPSGAGTYGGWWDGTRFHSLAADGRRIRYERDGNMWTTQTSAWDAYFTWYDSDAAGTGTHETAVSPPARFAMRKRARAVVTTALPADSGGADDPDQARVYLSRASTGARLQGASAAGKVTVTNATFTSATAPASNNFPGGVPAFLRSTTGGFEAKGDGTGAWPAVTNLPGIRRYRSTTQALTTSSTTQVTFNAETYDTHNYSSDGLTFTVPTGMTGLYDLEVSLVFAASGTGRRMLLVTLNDATEPTPSTTSTIGGDNRNAVSAGPTSLSTSIRRRLATGDVLRVWALQSSGANLDLTTNFAGCELTLTRIGTYA